MKKLAIEITCFVGGIVLIHWMGIILFSLVTPFRITQMTGSYTYSFLSLIISVIISGTILVELRKTFDR